MSNLPIDDKIPTDAVLLHIEERYGPLKNHVRCGLCGTLHGKGYIVCFATEGEQQLGIMGHVCGRNRFGVDYTKAERQWEVAKRGEELNGAIERFLIRAERIMPELEAALPRLKWQSSIRVALSKSGEEVIRAATIAVKSYNGRLWDEHHVVGRIRGEEFWLDFDAFRRVQDLKWDIARFKEYLGGKILTKDLRKRLAVVQDIEYRWDKIQKRMLDAEEALRPSNLERLFKFVNGQRLANRQPWDNYVDGSEWKLHVRMRGTVLERFAKLEEGRRLDWIVVSDLARNSHP